jgi:hypothetical protein
VPAPAPAATGESEREDEDERAFHFTAFDRTAPVAVARTSVPVCFPGQYAVPVVPGAVFFEPTCHWRPLTVAALPLSSKAVAV